MLCNISVYYTFIFIICCYFFLIIVFIIYTFLHLSWDFSSGVSIVTLYKASQYIFVTFSEITLCISPIFFSDIYISFHRYEHLGISVVSRLVSISRSEIYLCVSSRFLFTQSSITTGYESSGYLSLTSHISTTAGDVILGSVAFLFLY